MPSTRLLYNLFHEEECAICMNKIKTADKLSLSGCAHAFCRCCISEWICERKETCPCCRKIIEEKDQRYAINFGVVSGFLTPVYENIVHLTEMTFSERVAFKYLFRRCAVKLGLEQEITRDSISMKLFQTMLSELPLISIEAVIIFNCKAKMEHVFKGYVKTCSYSDIMDHKKQPTFVISIVQNFLL